MLKAPCHYCYGNGVHVVYDGPVRIGQQDCPVCHGEGRVNQQVQIALEKHPLPRGYRHTLADFEQMDKVMLRGKASAVAAARLFVERRGKMSMRDILQRVGMRGGDDEIRRGLVLAGNFGVGKTALAIAIARELINKQVPVLYLKLSEWISDLINATKEGGDYQVAMDRACKIPVLMLDEFNAQRTTDHTLQAVGELVDYRNRHELPYLVITNFEQAVFEEAWGAFITSRVNNACHWMDMGGAVFRTESPVIRDEDFGL